MDQQEMVTSTTDQKRAVRNWLWRWLGVTILYVGCKLSGLVLFEAHHPSVRDAVAILRGNLLITAIIAWLWPKPHLARLIGFVTWATSAALCLVAAIRWEKAVPVSAAADRILTIGTEVLPIALAVGAVLWWQRRQKTVGTD